MREPAQISFALPKPGRALKAILATIALFALVHAIVIVWIRSQTGAEIYERLLFQPRSLELVYTRPWTLLTSGLFTLSLGHLIMSLMGLYFLTTDLESRWGGWGLVRFVALSVILGNLAVLAGPFLPQPVVHQPIAAGPLAASTATARSGSCSSCR